MEFIKKYACLTASAISLFASANVVAKEISGQNWQFLASHVRANTPYTVQDRKKLHDMLQWSNFCDEGYNATMSTDTQTPSKPGSSQDAGIKQYSLGSQQFLLEISCGITAYNAVFSYYLVDINRKSANLLTFKTIDIDQDRKLIIDKTTEPSGLIEFSNGKLTVFAKGRGAGGCGSLIRYGFHNGKSYIVDARVRSCSDPMLDMKNVDPENWPIVYRDLGAKAK